MMLPSFKDYEDFQIHTLDDYLNLIRLRHKMASDRSVAIKLGISQATISDWRRLKKWPTDESMVKIAREAGMDVPVALVNLAYWKSTGSARNAWHEVAMKLYEFQKTIEAKPTKR